MTKKLQAIILLHTNDIHSRFENMPRVSTTIQNLRSSHPGVPTFTLDCGDHADRMRPETEGTRGLANMDVLISSGYDFLTIGNNEGLTFPREDVEVMYRLASESGMKVLCANLKAAADSGPLVPEWLLPWTVRDVNGVRIGFIGLTAAYPDVYRLLGWQVEEPLAALQRELPLLKKQADVIVLLSHLGLSEDRRLAETCEGIDLILGGHTHHVLETPLLHAGSYLCGGGMGGVWVGEVGLFVDLETKRLERVEGRLHPTLEAAEDAPTAQLIRRLRAEGERVLREPVAMLSQSMEIDWQGESRLGNLLAAALRDKADAELGLVNAGQLLHSLLPGPVTRGSLLSLAPSPINPCRMLLRGSRIRQALEESLLPAFVNKPLRGYGFRGFELGVLGVDGIRVWYDSSREPYRKLVQVEVNGEPLAEEREYIVGTIDMFTFGHGYLSLKEGRDIRFFLPEFIRDLLGEYLARDEALDAAGQQRWTDLHLEK